jgi:hypothetical protein
MARAAFLFGAGHIRPGIAPSSANFLPSATLQTSVSNGHLIPLENAATPTLSTNPPFLIDADAPCFSHAFYRSAAFVPVRGIARSCAAGTNYRSASTPPAPPRSHATDPDRARANSMKTRHVTATFTRPFAPSQNLGNFRPSRNEYVTRDTTGRPNKQ